MAPRTGARPSVSLAMYEATHPPLQNLSGHGERNDSESSNIKVCIRVRPFADREGGESCCVDMPNNHQVSINDPQNTREKEKWFDFDRTYWSHIPTDSHFATNQTLMDELGNEILHNAHTGFNSCLFAYGQTGSGKTHSVLGNERDHGLLPRIIEGLFKVIEDETTNFRSFSSKVSYLEIYNENIRDLLIPATEKNPKKLDVRHHPKVGIYVTGLTENAVTQYSDVKKMLEFGAKTRSVAATNMNAGSSRSHCIFCFDLEKRETMHGKKTQLRARVNLVDLAGSERQAKSGATGDRLKEGAMINQSLTNLALVIHKLAEASNVKLKRKTDFIPFRNSKLTHLLEESLSGNSKTLMMAAISPALSNYAETLGTLRFAMTCKSIQTKAVVNQESQESIIGDLKQEIMRLRQQHISGNGLAPPDIMERLAESEALRESLEKDQATQLAEAKRLEEARANALDDMGLSFDEILENFGMDKNQPQLVNISDDPSLSGCLVYFLKEGEEELVGGDKEKCRIVLGGLGMRPCMCSLLNEGNKKVTMTLLSGSGKMLRDKPVPSSDMKIKKMQSGPRREEPGRVLVNGRVPEVKSVVKHMDRLIIGHAFCFRCVLPAVSKGQQEKELEEKRRRKDTADEPVVCVCGNTFICDALFCRKCGRKRVHGEESVTLIDFLGEVLNEEQPEYIECRAMLDAIQDRIGTHSCTSFMEDFNRALPLVEEGNLITSEIRPQDLLRFQIEVCSDIMTFTSDEPELIVRLYQGQPDGLEVVVDVFEMAQFVVRLETMREIYADVQNEVNAVTWEANGLNDPWATYGYKEIQQIIKDNEREVLETMGSEGQVAIARLQHENSELRRQLADREQRLAGVQDGGISLRNSPNSPSRLQKTKGWLLAEKLGQSPNERKLDLLEKDSSSQAELSEYQVIFSQRRARSMEPSRRGRPTSPWK